MHGRKLFSTGPVAAIVVAVALVGGCREASTGPSDPNAAAFASAMQQVSGNAQTGQIGAALVQPLTVKVVDAGGTPVKGASVTFAARTGGGTITPASGTSDAGGIVTATWTLGTSLGAQKAVAMLSGTFVTDSTSFSATATPGPGTGFIATSGNDQVSVVGKTLAVPLVVKITDSFGNNISGIKVTWTPGGLSGTVIPPTDTTNNDGTATASWTLGNTAGTQLLAASVPGLPPIVFSAQASADTAHIIMTVGSGANQTDTVSKTLPTTLSVRLIYQFGNPIVGDVISWTDSVVGGGKVSLTTSATDASGMASTSWTLGARAGAQFLRAREGSKRLTANFIATANVAFSEVFAGNFMACGIAAANNLTYCWGVGDGGQLGKGSLTNASAPTTPVTTTSDSVNGPFIQVRQVSGGTDGFCALTIDRRLYCWGRTIGISAVTTAVATVQPIVTGGSSQQILPNFIAMGSEHVCLLDLSGLAFCTGNDLHGALGDAAGGVSPAIGTYPFVLASPPSGWAKIAAGQAHTCGMPRFNPDPTSNSQIARCWGLNTTGQVGNNHTSGSLGQQVPALVTLPAGVTFDSSSITAGAQHTCAIEAISSTAAGQAWCWGGNGFGQLGSSVMGPSTIDSVPTIVGPPASGAVTWARIYAGTYHTCAIATTGAAYCWGRDDYGQLGDGLQVPGNVVPQPVGGGHLFRSLSLGELYTCGVEGSLSAPLGPSTSAGTVYCWGDNLFGQIGNETTANNQPVLQPSKVHFQP
jgi:alpha-tubulin suppressor-like RCC1 family protein